MADPLLDVVERTLGESPAEFILMISWSNPKFRQYHTPASQKEVQRHRATLFAQRSIPKGTTALVGLCSCDMIRVPDLDGSSVFLCWRLSSEWK